MTKLANALILKGVPIAVAVASYYLSGSWWVAAVVLVTAVYWFGPIVVYFTQRMPATPSLWALDSDEPLPPAHSRVVDAVEPVLRGEGFAPVGRLTSGREKRPMLGTVVLLQQTESSDLSQVLVVTREGRAEAAEVLTFSRPRTDGSRIWTIRSTIPSPFPPNPSDDMLRLDGRIDTLDLWRLHRARVAADARAVRNARVTDALAFQTQLEIDSIRRHVDSGLWQLDDRPEFLRPTPSGAVLMCLRMLPPWKQITRLRARAQMRRYLHEFSHGQPS